MIRFLLRGILNDRSRSLLPIIVVSLGVAVTVLLYCWITGIMGESIAMNAAFNTGHLKVTTKAYAADENVMPNDLALLGADSLSKTLKRDFPEVDWVSRIRFGGLADFPDEYGETRAQGPVVGWAIDLLSLQSTEVVRLNVEPSLASGRMPINPGEALIADDFARKLNVKAGDVFTLFGTTMEGGMAFMNFTVAGTLRFGTTVLDRSAIFIDFRDAQRVFGMEDAVGEVFGFFTDGLYHDEEASRIMSEFNQKCASSNDEYAPIMRRIRDQGTMSEYMDYASVFASIMVVVFVMAMSVVLWNTGILGGLRRYSEFGLRLAMGEEKRHIYSTLIYEGMVIGGIGSVIGTLIGLGIAYYLQEVGFDIGSSMKNSSIMMPSTVRAIITPTAFYIGFWPGLVSMVLGNALSGLGIYKRQTAQLFKELET
jgi:putative ABC transport system permease protein